MADPMSAPHVYVDCDVPEGQTLAEYRAARRPCKRSWLRRLLAR